MRQGNAIFSIVRSREEIDHDRRLAELREQHDKGDCPADCDICEAQREVGDEAQGG